MALVDRVQQNRRLFVLLALGSLTVMPGAVIFLHQPYSAGYCAEIM